jgi:uncharacterized membrane protein YccF (DUF307 family)
MAFVKLVIAKQQFATTSIDSTGNYMGFVIAGFWQFVGSIMDTIADMGSSIELNRSMAFSMNIG